MVATGYPELAPKILEKEQTWKARSVRLLRAAQEVLGRKGECEFCLVLLLLLKIALCTLRWSVLLFIP